jgi:TATA-box binding protein (TBP) (component of TFIID and TFIIIB)
MIIKAKALIQDDYITIMDKISLPNQTEIMSESGKIISTGCKHIHRIFSENMLKKNNLYLVIIYYLQDGVV